MLIAMSASSIDVLYHLTPSALPPRRAHPTSLNPSKAWRPGHSLTNDGQREVVPPEVIRYVEPDTERQSP